MSYGPVPYLLPSSLPVRGTTVPQARSQGRCAGSRWGNPTNSLYLSPGVEWRWGWGGQEGIMHNVC